MKKTQSPINSRLYNHYKETIAYDLLLKQNIGNFLEIAQLEKIILNTTSKIIVSDKKNIIPGLIALELLSGQHQKITSAQKSIAGFKLRENQVIGCKVTLRGERMFNFLEKLITIILPRIRHFNPINFSHFDGKGNLSLGLSPILIIPELESYFEYFESIGGINISLITSGFKSLVYPPMFPKLQTEFVIKRGGNPTPLVNNLRLLTLPFQGEVSWKILHSPLTTSIKSKELTTQHISNIEQSKISLLQNNDKTKYEIDKKAALLFTGFQLPIAQIN